MTIEVLEPLVVEAEYSTPEDLHLPSTVMVAIGECLREALAKEVGDEHVDP